MHTIHTIHTIAVAKVESKTAAAAAAMEADYEQAMQDVEVEKLLEEKFNNKDT